MIFGMTEQYLFRIDQSILLVVVTVVCKTYSQQKFSWKKVVYAENGCI